MLKIHIASVPLLYPMFAFYIYSLPAPSSPPLVISFPLAVSSGSVAPLRPGTERGCLLHPSSRLSTHTHLNSGLYAYQVTLRLGLRSALPLNSAACLVLRSTGRIACACRRPDGRPAVAASRLRRVTSRDAVVTAVTFPACDGRGDASGSARQNAPLLSAL